MAYFDYSKLRSDTQTALNQQEQNPRKLVLLHSGVVIGLGLLLSVLSYLLDMGIAETGGLSGIGSRAALETVQAMLQIANLILLPFWNMGYTYAVVAMSKGQQVDQRSLLWGLGHWGVVLRSMFLQGLIYVALMMVGAQLTGIIFMLTPAAQPLFALAEEMTAAGMTDPYAMMDSPAYQQIALQMLPYILVGMLLFTAPVYYRLRFADYVLTEYPQAGALRAMMASLRITRKHAAAVLKLDLRFWWFYLAQALILVLGYGDLLLPMLGIDLGLHADVAMFAFYAAGLLCEFALYLWQKNQVSVTYALAYNQLMDDAAAQAKAQMQLQAQTVAPKGPWDA